MKLWIYGTMIAALAAVGVFCGYKYYTEVKRPEMELDAAADAQNVLFEEIRQSFSEPVPVPVTEATAAEAGQTPSETAPSEPRSAAVAWLTIPGTHIDYPVAQAADNEFYLYRGIDGELNQRLGCPFLDFRCASDFSGFNSIVYAHHMTKQRMFADIALYQDSRFMESCPTATLTTPGGQNTVRFFAYLTVPSTDAVYETYFESDEERAAYIDTLFASANYTQSFTAEELKQADDLHLLLLSTCTYEYEEARGVLAGVIED
jgi:sortase B